MPTSTPVPPGATRTVTIKLDVVPDNSSNFRFESTFGGFYLDGIAPQDTDAYSNTKSFVLPAQAQKVTAAATTNWALTAITCMPSNVAVVSLLATPLRQTTNSLGKADFTQLTPGSYTVCEVMQAGWQNHLAG